MKHSELVWPPPDCQVRDDGMYQFIWKLDPEASTAGGNAEADVGVRRAGSVGIAAMFLSER